MRALTLCCVVIAAALSCSASVGNADNAAQSQKRNLEIIVEGPPGPHPKGHALISITIYDAEADKSDAQAGVMATRATQLPVLELPATVVIEVDPKRLSAAKAPAASAFVAVGRRPAYVSKIRTGIANKGQTRVAVEPID